MSKAFVEVLLDQNLTRALDYEVPEGWCVDVGMRVEVSLKTSVKQGTISRLKTTSSYQTVKPLLKILSETRELSSVQMELASWMARYYMAPLQKVMRCFIPPNVRKNSKPLKRVFISLANSKKETLETYASLKNPIESRLIEILLQKPKGVLLTELTQDFQIPPSVIQKMIRTQQVSKHTAPLAEEFVLEEDFFPTLPKILNPEQARCVNAIENALDQKTFSAHLIHGVTGSGKTEVYLQAIQHALARKKSVILLVPEVSLTSQTIERFKARFQERLAILHHRRALGERSVAWQALKEGKIQIVIGARSAIFCPIQNLGLIIVDEEHDTSYKQSEEAPCYHARDVAVMRAHFEQSVVILGSATPSLESRHNVDIQKYTLHTLSARATRASMPKVQIIDMKTTLDKNGGFTHFAPELLEGIRIRLKKGEQTLLFLNKRGYHRLQICPQCRSSIKCPHCDLNLTFHKEGKFLQCHLCDYKIPPHSSCPGCGAYGTLEFKGFGTQHVEASLHAIFPDIKTLRMDKDTTQKKDSHEELFKQFRSHKADVLIGTQMIAKGFHFPSVTLVGVLNADSLLNIPEFRSSEQTFQLLTQVAGRSGRSDLNGDVIFQTFLPEHPVIKMAAAQNYDAFYTAEIQERKLFCYPPFIHFIKLLFSSPHQEKVKEAAEQFVKQLVPLLPKEAVILPPLPSGHPKVKDCYRFQALIKTTRIGPLTSILQTLEVPRGVQLKIDVDPLSTFF